MCTRGVTSKGPYSNRNLRWHPLVIANKEIPFAKKIERIEIEGEDDTQTLIFIIKENGVEKKFPSSRVHELKKTLCYASRALAKAYQCFKTME